MTNRFVPPATLVVSVALLALAIAPAGASADLMPSRSVCPAQTNARADKRDQEAALRCLVDYARAHSGARRVSSNSALERAAGHKSRDLAACGFTHTACGRAPDAWPKRFGYFSAGSTRWGENLATSTRRMTAREAVKRWLGSAAHRSTLLSGPFEHIGSAMRRSHGNTYWVLQLGCHGC